MSELMFSSGTVGNPKPVIFTDKDLKGLKRSMERMYEIHKASGVLYNLFPAAPHIAYNATRYYGEISGSLMINTGGGNVLPTKTVVNLMGKIKPDMIAGLPDYILKVLREAGEFVKDVKVVVGANGIDKNFVDECKRLCPNVKVLATYGFTEAKAVWITCGDLAQGYHVFPESGFLNRMVGNWFFILKIILKVIRWGMWGRLWRVYVLVVVGCASEWDLKSNGKTIMEESKNVV